MIRLITKRFVIIALAVCLLMSVVSVPAMAKEKNNNINQTNQTKIIKKAKSKLHSRYVWGASGPNSFDCSGFVSWVMKKSGKKTTGVKFSRMTAQGIYNKYKKYSVGKNIKKAKTADIILLGNHRSTHNIYHVGIYYKKGKYIHASTPSTGVAISHIPKHKVASIVRLPGIAKN